MRCHSSAASFLVVPEDRGDEGREGALADVLDGDRHAATYLRSALMSALGAPELLTEPRWSQEARGLASWWLPGMAHGATHLTPRAFWTLMRAHHIRGVCHHGACRRLASRRRRLLHLPRLRL